VRLSIKASKQSQQCAFATAAGAYDGQKFSSGNVDIQNFEGSFRTLEAPSNPPTPKASAKKRT